MHELASVSERESSKLNLLSDGSKPSEVRRRSTGDEDGELSTSVRTPRVVDLESTLAIFLSSAVCRTVSASANWHHATSIKLMTKQPQRTSQRQVFLALLSTFALASPRTSRSRFNRKPCTDAAPFSSSFASTGPEGERSNTQCELLCTSCHTGQDQRAPQQNGLGS